MSSTFGWCDSFLKPSGTASIRRSHSRERHGYSFNVCCVSRRLFETDDYICRITPRHGHFCPRAESINVPLGWQFLATTTQVELFVVTGRVVAAVFKDREPHAVVRRRIVVDVREVTVVIGAADDYHCEG